MKLDTVTKVEIVMTSLSGVSHDGTGGGVNVPARTFAYGSVAEGVTEGKGAPRRAAEERVGAGVAKLKAVEDKLMRSIT